ncbi:Histone lysine acetyltransferase CREBBP [Halotydeus destructor]|nr:Histone lysine acetyltransferase CREBBP [Halotydeus destructor]
MTNEPPDHPSQFACCGKHMKFAIRILFCIARMNCKIEKNQFYHIDENENIFCDRCFKKQSDPVILGSDCEINTPKISVKKKMFDKRKNKDTAIEPTVNCEECKRKYHQICVMYIEKIHHNFICDECLAASGRKRPTHAFTADRLPQTNLAGYIQSTVEKYLRDSGAGSQKVTIKVLSTNERVLRVKERFREATLNVDFSENFPYRAKAIFAFQEFDGVDVLFFGMHVQEYGSESPEPNRRKAYITYLDSVNFFSPKRCRTWVYRHIILSYLHYMKNLGYNSVHFWSCPPSQGDDYIFYCHPPEQKFPKDQRLLDWYKAMLDYGVSTGRIVSYQSLKSWYEENGCKSVMELPYFDGDYWPNIIEDSIQEYRNEKGESGRLRKKAKSSQYGLKPENGSYSQSSVDSQNNKNKKNKSKKQPPGKKCARVPSSPILAPLNPALSVLEEIDSTESALACLTIIVDRKLSEFYKNFISVKLSTGTSEEIDTFDADMSYPVELFNGRFPFLTECRKNYHEFSSLRHAKYSTQSILVMIHEKVKEVSLSKFNSFIRAKDCKNVHCSDEVCKQLERLKSLRDGSSKANSLLLSLETKLRDAGNDVDICTAWLGVQEKQLQKMLLHHVQYCSGCKDTSCKVLKMAELKEKKRNDINRKMHEIT